eukprot:4511184-Pleurochrysis_carterae.AAC.2
MLINRCSSESFDVARATPIVRRSPAPPPLFLKETGAERQMGAKHVKGRGGAATPQAEGHRNSSGDGAARAADGTVSAPLGAAL